MINIIPKDFKQKNSIPENSTFSIHIYKLDEKNLWIENTTKLSRGQVSICFGYYPTPFQSTSI